MPKVNEPFHPYIQNYLCQRLGSLSEEEYKMLSVSERHSILTVGKIKSFVKQKSIFRTLDVLTKIGINWGFYIIDNSFEFQRYIELYEDSNFVQRKESICSALKTQKSFITDSKQYAELLNLMSSESHGQLANWDRRYIDFSEKVSTKVKENFDNYDILNEEIQYKKTSEGTKIMLQLFANLPKTSRVCKSNNITLTEFSLLCAIRLKESYYYTKELIISEFGNNCNANLKSLTKKELISYTKHYNITTKGMLLTGRIFSSILSNVDLVL